jgi:hypothetical protein
LFLLAVMMSHSGIVLSCLQNQEQHSHTPLHTVHIPRNLCLQITDFFFSSRHESEKTRQVNKVKKLKRMNDYQQYKLAKKVVKAKNGSSTPRPILHTKQHFHHKSCTPQQKTKILRKKRFLAPFYRPQRQIT